MIYDEKILEDKQDRFGVHRQVDEDTLIEFLEIEEAYESLRVNNFRTYYGQNTTMELTDVAKKLQQCKGCT